MNACKAIELAMKDTIARYAAVGGGVWLCAEQSQTKDSDFEERRKAEVAAAIGADWLVYQDLEDLVQACRHDHASITQFDTSCFSGVYCTGDVTPEYLARLQQERNDTVRVARLEPQLRFAG